MIQATKDDVTAIIKIISVTNRSRNVNYDATKSG